MGQDKLANVLNNRVKSLSTFLTLGMGSWKVIKIFGNQLSARGPSGVVVEGADYTNLGLPTQMLTVAR